MPRQCQKSSFFLFMLFIIIALLYSCKEQMPENLPEISYFKVLVQSAQPDSIGFFFDDSLEVYSHRLFYPWPALGRNGDSLSYFQMKKELESLFWQEMDSLLIKGGDSLNQFFLSIYAAPTAIFEWQKARTVVITHSRPAYSWHIRAKGLEITRVRPRSQYYGYLQKNDFIVMVNDTIYQRAILGNAESAVVAQEIPFIKLGVLRGDDTLSYRVVCRDTEYYKSWQKNMILLEKDSSDRNNLPDGLPDFARDAPVLVETVSHDTVFPSPGLLSRLKSVFQTSRDDTISLTASPDSILQDTMIRRSKPSADIRPVILDSLEKRPGIFSRLLAIFQKSESDSIHLDEAVDSMHVVAAD